MSDPNPTFEQVDLLRRRFRDAMHQFEKEGGTYLDRGPWLEARHVEGCVMLPTRYDLLDRLPRNGVVCEVGTDRGDFAREIIRRTSPREMHIIDIDLSRLTPENREFFDSRPEITLHEGDSSSLLSALQPDAFDWIYIDADHYYDGVKKDRDAAIPRLKPGGRLVFNDYASWSVAGMTRCGVVRAVNELCVQNGWRMEYFALQPLMYCDVSLVRL